MTSEGFEKLRMYGHIAGRGRPENIESLFKDVTRQATSASSSNEALAALGTLQVALAHLNLLSKEDPDEAAKIVEKLSKRIQKLKEDLQKIVDKSGAKGFSISVGVPLGIAVSVEW